jgi:hypothetical protein
MNLRYADPHYNSYMQPQQQSPNLDAIVVPKVHFVTDVIRHCRPEGHTFGPTEPPSKPLRVLALIEPLAQSLTRNPYVLPVLPSLFAFDLSITRTPP